MSTTTPHTQTAYKDTPIGKIPADWEIIQLKSVIEELEAGVSVNSIDDEVSQTQPRVLKTSSVSGGAFFPHESKIIAPSDINKAKLNPRKDSIIISRMNTPDLVGETGFVERNYPTLFLPDRLWQTKFRSDNNSVYPKWLNFLLSSSEYKLKIKDIATGTSNSMKNISKQAFLNLKIPLPPLPEQKRIAEVLSTWDQAIQLTEQLIRQKEQRKKWLMQNLLTGKMRLKGFSGEWKFVKFKDFYSESKLKVGSKKYEVLSVTKTGIVPQSEYFNKEIASSNTSNYLIVEKGDFVVSGLNFWMGSFDVLSNFDIGIVSPAYKVYKLKVGFEKTFFKFLSKSKLMLDAMIGASIVGASIVRRNFDKEILMEWSFKIPSIEEQTAIAEVLQTADKEIELLKAKAEQLKEQKKGLMQQLLTGKKRLNLNLQD